VPLFHFNSRTGDVVLPDTEGEELPNVTAAREAAVVSARETLIEAVKTQHTPPDCIQVTDRLPRRFAAELNGGKPYQSTGVGLWHPLLRHHIPLPCAVQFCSPS
jgi:hypothetical protein